MRRARLQGASSALSGANAGAAQATGDHELGRHQKAVSRSAWRQPLAVAGLAVGATWLVVAVAAPLIAPSGPLERVAAPYLAPSSAHWFGTDDLGRDVFSRLLYGARASLPLSMLLVAIASIVGGVLGGIAGYLGGVVDEIIMRITDMVFAFPTIILAMAVAAALGPSLRNAVLAIVVVSWPVYARVVRGLVLSARETDYVAASRLLGSSSRRALRVEILPNIVGPVAVLSMLEVGHAALWLSGLSFLGLGAQPPAPEWGAMVAAGTEAFNRWWIGVFPGLAILSVVLAVNFVGDSLRDALDLSSARAVRERENA